MALHFCRRTFSTLKNSSLLLTTQPLTSHVPITSKLLLDAKRTVQARYSTERPRLGLRRQNLPPFPPIDCVRSLELSTFLPTHYKQVKIGDYTFTESADGFVMVYVDGYRNPRDLHSRAGFAVYFGENHPLNLTGSVLRRQEENHAKLYAVMQAFKQVPENSLQKLCLCFAQMPLITFIDGALRSMSENSFRSLVTGKLNKDLETSMEINRLIRQRQDLTLRLKYVPSDIGVDGIYHANRMAIAASEEATKEYRNKELRKVEM